MNFYKINSDLDASLTAYAREAEAVELAADELAKSVGAAGYAPSPHGEFGGVCVLDFAGKAPHYFRFAGDNGAYRSYEPAVNITETVENNGFVRGLQRKQTKHVWYDVREITLLEARALMDYSRAIELAHLKWEGTNIMALAEKYRLAPSWMQAYHDGQLSFPQLCQKAKDYALKFSHEEKFNEELREAMSLETLLMEAFSTTKLYRVRTVRGSLYAIDFYKKMSALPLIPAGRLAALLGVRYMTDEVACPAFFKADGQWYVATKGQIAPEKGEEISEMEWETAKMHRGVN